MLPNSFNHFFEEFGRAINDHDAAVFAGAGLSVPAGFKTWPALLADVASDLGLEIDRETDLLALAQFHVNERRVRSRLNQLLSDEFSGGEPTDNHRLIASLPIETVWTTNYDHLIEKAFELAGKRYDAKVTVPNLATTVRGRDVTIYKMHGDVAQPQDAVLTKEDYELFGLTREPFINGLKGDLVNKTFLFLGFSFTDPNMDYVLGRIRALLGQNPREHFCVMRKPKLKQGKGISKAKARADLDYELRRLDLRISDLRRYGIHALLIDDYEQITEILHELNRRANRKTVFVSGSAFDFAPMGQARAEALADRLGRELIRAGYNIVSGFGFGIGSALLGGAMEEVSRLKGTAFADRISVRPFPQIDRSSPDRAEIYTAYRREMISQAGSVMVLCGSRKAENGDAETAEGVLEECSIAAGLGRPVIPIGATGWAAEQLWLSSDFAAKKSKDFQVIGTGGNSDAAIVKSAIALLDSSVKPR